jgi:hypothetical protein
MASDRQIAANRANARRSTGPKTNAGKALSRMNALRHGLTAHKLLVNGESPQDFEASSGVYSGPALAPPTRRGI